MAALCQRQRIRLHINIKHRAALPAIGRRNLPKTQCHVPSCLATSEPSNLQSTRSSESHPSRRSRQESRPGAKAPSMHSLGVNPQLPLALWARTGATHLAQTKAHLDAPGPTRSSTGALQAGSCQTKTKSQVKVMYLDVIYWCF